MAARTFRKKKHQQSGASLLALAKSIYYFRVYLAKPLSKPQDRIHESKIVQCAEYVV